MNKQVIIAGVLGVASAQTDCTNAFVKAAREAKADLTMEKSALDAKTTPLADALALEVTAEATAQGRVTTQEAIYTPLNTALTTAKDLHKVQTDIVAAATAEQTSLAGPVSTTATDLTNAQTAKTTAEGKVTTQATIVAELATAVADHVAEKAIMQTAATAAATAEATAIQNETDATTAKNAQITVKGTAITGEDAVLATATSDLTAKEGLLATANTNEQTGWTTTGGGMKAAKKAFAEATKTLAFINEGCTFTDSGSYVCTSYANDAVSALHATWTTNESTTSGTKTGLDSAYNALVTAVATAEDVEAQYIAKKQVATDNVTTIDSAITTLTGAETTATAAKTTAISNKQTADTNLSTVDGQLTQANTDKARGDTLLATLTADVVPLNDAVVVAAYLKKIQDDLLAVEVARKSVANGKLAALLNLKTMAQATLDRAATTKTFYDGLLASATASKTSADTLVTNNANAIIANTAALAAADVAIAMAVAECKEAGYDKAQAAKKALMDLDAANTAAAATVKTDYDAKAAFSTSGETNTICAYPAKAVDAAQEPRPACKDGFCCGAAQKFLKDGTKLAIETCQTVGVHTYQYYPPLPASAAVEPTPETWRFQCISGAQKLAAAATAALAASYMMA